MLQRDLLPVDGGQLEIFRGGNGDAVICTSHQYSVHSGEPGGLSRALSSAGRLIAVNPRGAGGSSSATDMRQSSMAQLVEDLEAVRGGLGESSWIFAGASAGGMVGLLYALAYPAALAGLAISGAAASWQYIADPDSIYHPRHPAYRELARATGEALRPDASPENRRRLWELMLEASLHKKELLRALLERSRAGSVCAPRLAAFLAQIHGPRKFELTARLSEIQVPTLVLCGRYDTQCPLRHSETLARQIPNARLVVFEESGHYPYSEEPERFAAVFREFVADCAGPRAS